MAQEMDKVLKDKETMSAKFDSLGLFVSVSVLLIILYTDG